MSYNVEEAAEALFRNSRVEVIKEIISWPFEFSEDRLYPAWLKGRRRVMTWAQVSPYEPVCPICRVQMMNEQELRKVRWTQRYEDCPLRLQKTKPELWVHDHCWEAIEEIAKESDLYVRHRRLLAAAGVEAQVSPPVEEAKVVVVMDEATLSDLVCKDAGSSWESKFFRFSSRMQN